jgi:hypothetical protein
VTGGAASRCEKIASSRKRGKTGRRPSGKHSEALERALFCEILSQVGEFKSIVGSQSKTYTEFSRSARSRSRLIRSADGKTKHIKESLCGSCF